MEVTFLIVVEENYKYGKEDKQNEFYDIGLKLELLV